MLYIIYDNIYEQNETNDRIDHITHEDFCMKQVQILNELIKKPEKLYSKQMSYIPKDPPSDLSQIENGERYLGYLMDFAYYNIGFLPDGISKNNLLGKLNDIVLSYVQSIGYQEAERNLPKDQYERHLFIVSLSLIIPYYHKITNKSVPIGVLDFLNEHDSSTLLEVMNRNDVKGNENIINMMVNLVESGVGYITDKTFEIALHDEHFYNKLMSKYTYEANELFSQSSAGEKIVGESGDNALGDVYGNDPWNFKILSEGGGKCIQFAKELMIKIGVKNVAYYLGSITNPLLDNNDNQNIYSNAFQNAYKELLKLIKIRSIVESKLQLEKGSLVQVMNQQFIDIIPSGGSIVDLQKILSYPIDFRISDYRSKEEDSFRSELYNQLLNEKDFMKVSKLSGDGEKILPTIIITDLHNEEWVMNGSRGDFGGIVDVGRYGRVNQSGLSLEIGYANGNLFYEQSSGEVEIRPFSIENFIALTKIGLEQAENKRTKEIDSYSEFKDYNPPQGSKIHLLNMASDGMDAEDNDSGIFYSAIGKKVRENVFGGENVDYNFSYTNQPMLDIKEKIKKTYSNDVFHHYQCTLFGHGSSKLAGYASDGIQFGNTKISPSDVLKGLIDTINQCTDNGEKPFNGKILVDGIQCFSGGWQSELVNLLQNSAPYIQESIIMRYEAKSHVPGQYQKFNRSLTGYENVQSDDKEGGDFFSRIQKHDELGGSTFQQILFLQELQKTKSIGKAYMNADFRVQSINGMNTGGIYRGKEITLVPEVINSGSRAG